ncbi:MAG: CBS domain-containing protein [Thaumarchaeota archaeon]|nr:CBS domain-containing protein [Nitrososphaerota archaeon]MDE1840439.1 CBS domain-containing protein [Nitrososphaerota archaeon]MDE1878145.1 CBS domain-containing protein [Nitrososphaerota archaeon]
MSTALDIMSKKLVTLDSTVSASEVAKIMDKNNVSCIVLTKNEKLQGIVTEKDLLSKVMIPAKKIHELAASEIMTSPITVVSLLTPVNEIAQKMLDNKIRRVVVVDGERPRGIITVTDFVKHINTILSDSENSKIQFYKNLFEDYEDWIN